jgi:hypothetical protein
MQFYACCDFDELKISPSPLVGVSICAIFLLHDPLFEEDGNGFLSVARRCGGRQTTEDGLLCGIESGVALFVPELL